MEFRRDDGVPILAIGLPAGTNNSVLGAKYARSAILNSVSWYLGGTTNHPTVNVFIFGLNAQGQPNSNALLYHAQSVPNNHQQWTIYELSEEVEATNGFLIGLSVVGNLGIAADDGVGEPYIFQNNTHYFTTNYTTGTWSTMESAGYYNNFLLRAQGFDLGPTRGNESVVDGGYLFNSGKELIAENINRFVIPRGERSGTSAKRSIERERNRVLVGFIIYRLAAGQEQQPHLWDEIGTVPSAETSFVDEGLPELLNGTYRYAVRSVYTNNVLSIASLSNTIQYQETIPYITGLQANVDGGVIHLTWQWMRNEVRTRNRVSRDVSEDDSTARFDERAFLGFKITRDGPVIAEGVMETEYTDIVYQTGQYIYTVIGEFTNGSTNMLMIQVQVTSDVEDEPVVEPLVTALLGNHPNPFNPDTTIRYSLESDERVIIDVYNIRGQLVKTLVNDYQRAGQYSVIWDGKDERGRDAGSGIFFYRMKSGSYSSTRKMIMMK